MRLSLGIDVGSVSTDIVALTEDDELIADVYIRTRGNPIGAIKEGLLELLEKLKGLGEPEVIALGTTGSARFLAGVITGADMVKNEISAHAVATIREFPDVSTIFEIGGQDSKIIIVRNGIVVDFAMNTVCAAGTGSFLDHQAERLGIRIEEFGDYALRSKTPVRIAGRCTVFAESDMIHKQQMGASIEDIIRGLSESLVRNYLTNVGRGKELLPRFVFQGGVSENKGIKKAFEDAVGHEVYVPKHNKVMGAIGAAILAHHEVKTKHKRTNFRGFDIADRTYKTRTFYCNACSNNCEIYEIREEGRVLARWGDRCGRWTGTFQVDYSNKEKVTV